MHLRVWFNKIAIGKDGQLEPEQKNGIVICGDYKYFQVRTDDGNIRIVPSSDVVKSEWVNYPHADGEEK